MYVTRYLENQNNFENEIGPIKLFYVCTVNVRRAAHFLSLFSLILNRLKPTKEFCYQILDHSPKSFYKNKIFQHFCIYIEKFAATKFYHQARGPQWPIEKWRGLLGVNYGQACRRKRSDSKIKSAWSYGEKVKERETALTNMVQLRRL